MSGHTILNVDDHSSNRYVKTRMLRQAGFQVLEAATGQSALDLATDRRPDLVLLDINLPDISGLEVCRRLRLSPRTRPIPIIHISATFVTSRDEMTSLEAGADFYLAEPVGANELTAAVRTLVRLRTMEQGLAASQERLLLATEGAGIATWDIELDSGAAVWSQRFYELLGYSKEGTPPSRQAWLERVRPEERDAVAAALDRASAGAARFECEHWIERADNGEPRCLAAFGRLHVGDDALSGRLIGVVMDITARRRAEAEREALLERARLAQKEAEAATRMKDEFLATLSHELRTPMSAMLGWLQLLRTGKLSAEQRASALDTIERNARLQSQLVDDLLDVSRIVSGKLQVESVPVAIDSVLGSAIDAARPVAAARDITLVPEVTKGAGMVLGSPERLQQVFSNLLMNAIKFTAPGGRVEVRMDVVQSSVRIRVIDTGEGIAPELLPFIFDRFRQADSSSRRYHGGLGLGLAIVRSLVALHAGTVTAESAGPGQGATFTVTLPLMPQFAASDAGPEAANGGALGSLHGLRVLIVDDNEDAAAMVAQMLKLGGAAVEVIHAAALAVPAIRASRPDVLVLDIGMPGEDGYQLLERLRREPGMDAASLPAIALTGFAATEDKARAYTSGFQAHLAKPFEMTDLYRLVRLVAPIR